MSRARTQRRKAARAHVVPAVATGPSPAARVAGGGGSRLEPARRRARYAKVTLGVAGTVVFAAAMALARTHYSGHAKQPIRKLAAPPAFVRVVRQSALQAGILAPAEAPPDAATSQS